MIVCQKIRFASRAAAKARAREIKNNQTGRALRPYECSVCPEGTWHLTSYTKREMRQTDRRLGRR